MPQGVEPPEEPVDGVVVLVVVPVVALGVLVSLLFAGVPAPPLEP
jgi:hypothetical protein